MAELVSTEGSLAAELVCAGAVVLAYQPTSAGVVSGFYVRLTHCIGPRNQPVVIGIRRGGALLTERVMIPVYGEPLNLFTRTGGKVFPPLDVGQEYRVALKEPLAMVAGDMLALEVISSEPLASGVTAGLQMQGVWPLLKMREPFRPTKSAGPVCRVAWSAPQRICTGTQKPFDPRCAPQNNSGVVSDADGTLHQFTAFYSVDEQYGGGREESYSRVFAFVKRTGAADWEMSGLPFDLPPGISYIGDPFAFRDLEGRPCLVYSMVDGTRGFVDWQHIWGCIRRSKTNSFAGPWGEPHHFWEKLPGEGYRHRCICLRVYPRTRTHDYALIWLAGGSDITLRGAILPDLAGVLTHQQVLSAPILARNQEEGGGGFVHGDKGYLSTWQIPNINDVTSVQRLYEFDLADPLSPHSWRAVPGSWGFNDGTNAVEDGGTTADSWSLSMVGEELFATSVAWSVSQRLNSVLVRQVRWNRCLGDVFRYGVSRVQGYHEVAPVVEHALGADCSLKATITAAGEETGVTMGLAPSDRPLLHGGIAVEISDAGSRLVAYCGEGKATGLTAYTEPRFYAGRPYTVELIRREDQITGKVDGQEVGVAVITEPAQRALLSESQRFKFHGWRGGMYEVREAVLVDGLAP